MQKWGIDTNKPDFPTNRKMAQTTTQAGKSFIDSANTMLMMLKERLQGYEDALDRGQPLPTTWPSGMTPLHLAAMFGDTAKARKFIAAGADVNAGDDNGFRPLHLALKYTDPTPMTKLLLDAGADPYLVDNKGLVPMHYAYMYTHDVSGAMSLLSGAMYEIRKQKGEQPKLKTLFVDHQASVIWTESK